MKKSFWKSKTIWVNLLTLATALLASEEVSKLISPITLVKIQAAANIGLRIITSKPLSFGDGGNA